MPEIQILPSILAADPGHLARDCRRAEQAGADGLHVDIMDGHFVPNISFGPEIVRMARKTVNLPLNVHLMISNPDQYAETFVQAGADTLLIHVEAESDPRPVLDTIRKAGARPGIVLNPATPLSEIQPYLGEVDEVLFMTVVPGFGGQAFMPEVLEKLAACRTEFPELDIGVDGGLNRTTIPQAHTAGANVFDAGTFLFAAPDMADEINALRTSLSGAA